MSASAKGQSPETRQEALMLGYLCVKDLDGLAQKVGVLDRFEFSDVEIGTICGATTGSVRNARLALKRATTGRK